MDFVDGDVVAAFVAGVCLAADFGANVHLGCEADDADAYTVFDACFDGVVDVSRVAGEEGAEDDDDLACAVGWGVVEGCSSHFESILEGWVAFGLEAAQVSDSCNVIVWIAAHVADACGDSLAHS